MRKLFDAIIALVNQIGTPHSFLFSTKHHRHTIGEMESSKIVVCAVCYICASIYSIAVYFEVLWFHLFFKSIDSFGILFKLFGSNTFNCEWGWILSRALFHYIACITTKMTATIANNNVLEHTRYKLTLTDSRFTHNGIWWVSK